MDDAHGIKGTGSEPTFVIKVPDIFIVNHTGVAPIRQMLEDQHEWHTASTPTHHR